MKIPKSFVNLDSRFQRYLPMKVAWTNMDKGLVLQTTTASAMFFFDLLKVVAKNQHVSPTGGEKW